MEQRWTIRRVSDRSREYVRRARLNTGMSAGQIVSAAILEWVEAHPDVMTDRQQDEEDDLTRSLRNLEQVLARQAQLFSEV